MAAEHFASLVTKHRNGRSDRQIAAAADIPLHWLSYPLRPGTVLRTKPDDNRIAVLARAIGATVEEVDKAFERDVAGEAPYEGLRGRTDGPLTAEAHRLFAGLDVPHRVTAIAMLKSLNTLQRKTGAADDEIREVG